MDEVLPGLWVGGVRAAMDADYLSRAGITHVISCMKQRLPTPPVLDDGRTISRSEMRHVRLDDDEKAPILAHFAGCNDFIAAQLQEEWVADDEADSDSTPGGEASGAAHESALEDDDEGEEEEDSVELLVQGRQKRAGRWGSWQTTGAGTVLVHCQAGCSRSVAIVAAYLMHTRRIGASTAVAMVRARRPEAGPNAGFMAQLELYEQVGFEVDMKFQAVRRFLMSKTDILNGDSMDDMLLAYYPSPYPSPALSAASGIKGFTAITSAHHQDDASEGGVRSRRNSERDLAGGGGEWNLGQFGKKDSCGSTTISSATTEGSLGEDVSGRPRSRSASVCSSASSSSGGTGARISLLSSINDAAAPLRSGTSGLENRLSAMETSQTDSSGSVGDGGAGRTRVQEEGEVKVTANSSGRLPGGVAQIRGHEGVTNRGALAKPTFAGPKLRCRACRRELAALDHVVIHEPGKGQLAFDHRRRDARSMPQNVPTTASNPAAQQASSAPSSESTTPASKAVAASTTSQGETVGAAQQPGSAQSSKSATPASSATASSTATAQADQPAAHGPSSVSTPTAAGSTEAEGGRGGSVRAPMQTASRLAAQLPAHLAALRARTTGPSTRSMESMLKSAACSAYFIEPMAWMSQLGEGAVTGRLSCPNAKCAAKLGAWDWAGSQCACGAWITPAFALHRSKVDQV